MVKKLHILRNLYIYIIKTRLLCVCLFCLCVCPDYILSDGGKETAFIFEIETNFQILL